MILPATGCDDKGGGNGKQEMSFVLTGSKSGIQAANQPSTFSQSERHKTYSARNARKVATMFDPEAGAEEQRERTVGGVRTKPSK